LDVAIFKPSETFYDQAINKWLRSNPGQCVTQFQVYSLLSEVFGKAASIFNATNGFRATGLWSVDRSVFSENDFIPSVNLNTADDTCNGDPCCSGAPQSGEDQQKEVQNSVSSFKNLCHITDVTIDGSPSVKKLVPIYKISPLPKPRAHY
jgi:hypothetical protein